MVETASIRCSSRVYETYLYMQCLHLNWMDIGGRWGDAPRPQRGPRESRHRGARSSAQSPNFVELSGQSPCSFTASVREKTDFFLYIFWPIIIPTCALQCTVCKFPVLCAGLPVVRSIHLQVTESSSAAMPSSDCRAADQPVQTDWHSMTSPRQGTGAVEVLMMAARACPPVG